MPMPFIIYYLATGTHGERNINIKKPQNIMPTIVLYIVVYGVLYHTAFYVLRMSSYIFYICFLERKIIGLESIFLQNLNLITLTANFSADELFECV